MNTSSNILCHIVGLDDIHKMKIIKNLPADLKAIDLDMYQQVIYNDPLLVEYKTKWQNVGNSINLINRQKKFLLDNPIAFDKLDQKIKYMTSKRNKITSQIHELWKEKMSIMINNKINETPNEKIVLLGLNIFPKDYRQKINLSLDLSKENRFSIDMSLNTYCSNQIKYYLRKFEAEIISGKFPLNLLSHDYLSMRYEKIITHYDKYGYKMITMEQLPVIIEKLKKEPDIQKYVYVPSHIKAHDYFPVNSRTPQQGFLHRDDAISYLHRISKKPTTVHIYQVPIDHFQMLGGKMVAMNELPILEAESFILDDENMHDSTSLQLTELLV